MTPRRKRQRLSDDGTDAITAFADVDDNPNAVSTVPKTVGRRQLFIRGLAPTVTTEALTDFFSESYPIKHALVVLDKTTKESKGFGFVTFADVEDAQRAKEELNESELEGKKIRIEVAEARQREGEGVVSKTSNRIKADRDQQIKEAQTPKLIIRNLPWSVKNTEQLEKLFRSYGKVNFVNLPKKPSGELRGFAFVSLRGKKNAEKAIEELNGKQVDGRPIAVDWAVDRDTWQGLQRSEQEAEVDTTADSGANEEDASEPDSSSLGSDQDSEHDSEQSYDEKEELDDSNTEYEDSLEDEEDAVKPETDAPKRTEHTVFIRNVPFTVDDDTLYEHFEQFGKIRFARVVIDRDTDRPKGTGFVSFFNEDDMVNCLKGIPRVKLQKRDLDKKDGSTITVTHSVLENEDADPTGKYTIDGRILHITQAVDKNEAARLTAEGATSRFNRDKDKRRLYLLSEGTIASNSPLYQRLAPTEVKMREESAMMRRKQIQENPSLHLSLTRLSIRNIPRNITSKDLKQLARSAVVGFAADVKSGKRQKLSREEVIRGGEAMVVAEKMRKKRGKGIVKQAKVVFETPQGSKVTDDTGAGRSRGYGFIEYYTHRNALMGLRWLNGHAVDYKVKCELPKSRKAAKEALEDKRKRLIVEFAIENANVVSRRSDREEQARQPQEPKGVSDTTSGHLKRGEPKGQKRKRGSVAASSPPTATKATNSAGQNVVTGSKTRKLGADTDAASRTGAKSQTDTTRGKMVQRTRIIAKKRQARKARKAVKA